MKVTLSDKYREFDTLKSRFRDVLSTDSRFRLVGAPQYHDERKIFECPAVDKRLYVSDEIDIAIETAAANLFRTGGRIPSRTDFLRRTPDAGWLEAFFGVTPLPRPATERMLGAQHGASLVYSQNEKEPSSYCYIRRTQRTLSAWRNALYSDTSSRHDTWMKLEFESMWTL